MSLSPCVLWHLCVYVCVLRTLNMRSILLIYFKVHITVLLTTGTICTITQTRCGNNPNVHHQIIGQRKMWYTHTIEYDSALKKKKILHWLVWLRWNCTSNRLWGWFLVREHTSLQVQSLVRTHMGGCDQCFSYLYLPLISSVSEISKNMSLSKG